MRGRLGLVLLVCGSLVLASHPRAAIGQAVVGGFAVMGDSSSDEYRADDNRGGAYAATTLNWIELLARYRGLDFGAWATRAEPRRTGYEFNWARSGAQAAHVISQGQAAGVAEQVAAGRVAWAVLMIGTNDFAIGNGTYGEIYSGTLSGPALTAKIDGIVSSVADTIDTVRAAGPVLVLVGNLPALDLPPSHQGQFPDPARRQLVVDAVVRVNAGITAVAGARNVPIVDLDAFAASTITGVDANGNLHVGGELISLLVPGDEPHHSLLGDNKHAGTVSQGMIANYILAQFEQLAAVGGPVVTPFTDEELLRNAGIVPVTPDTTPPTVAIQSPLSGAVVSGSVSITAAASDDQGVAGVQFQVNGVTLGSEDTSAPYATTWNTTGAAPGSHVLKAIARDAAGNVAVAQITVTIVGDQTPPTVTWTAPTTGAQVAGSVTLRATASDNVGVVGVRFKVDGNNVGAEDTTAPFTATWNTATTPNGPRTLTATARDAAGNVTTATVTVNVRNPETLTPSSYTVVTGTHQSGSLASLGADDNSHLVVRSTTSGLERTASAELVFSGVTGPVTRLDVSTILKSSTSSTTARLYLYDVVAGVWTQLASSTIGTSEVARTGAVSTSASRYVGPTGTVRLRVQSSRLLSTHSLSLEQARLTVTH
jgi:Bacterial Ig domain/GDSL-like Lipase/Acylhydrolase family